MCSNPKRQSGQYLIAAVLAIALLAGGLALWGTVQAEHYYDQYADLQGAALAEYGVGLRGFIANVQGGSATMPANPYTVAGVNWLKPPACGGLATNPTEGYVPCDFTGGPLGSIFSTTITQTPATNAISAATWFMVDPESGKSKASMGVLASKIAFAALAQQNLPINGMFLNVFSNAPATATAQPPPNAINPVDRGRVVLLADNAPSNDIWLRVDGTNKMLADLNMGGHSLVNANNGSFAGSVRVQGTEQIDNGLSVTNGTADLRGGVIAPDVQVTSVNRMASQAIYDAQVFTGATSYTVPKPDCSAANLGASSPAIYVALQGTGSPSGQGDALYESHAQVSSVGSNWVITPVAETVAFSLTGGVVGNNLQLTLNKTLTTLSPADQTILVMTKCR